MDQQSGSGADAWFEIERSFERMRAALRAESRHERDIVRLDLDGLEASARQVLLGERDISVPALANLFANLEKVKEEARNLYGARKLILTELAVVEGGVRSWDVQEKLVRPASQGPNARETAIDNRHKYFLSYSHDDSAIADHFESLLRRRARAVVRDETDLKAGGDLNDEISGAIKKADTVISLWSRGYRSSSWCRGELSYCRDLVDKGSVKLRLVMIEVDGTEIPPRFANVLRLSGEDRARRELAVAKLVDEE